MKMSLTQNIDKLEKQKRELEKVIDKLKLEKTRKYIADGLKKRKWIADIDIDTCKIHVYAKPNAEVYRDEVDKIKIADYHFTRIDAVMYKGKPTLDFIFEAYND